MNIFFYFFHKVTLNYADVFFIVCYWKYFEHIGKICPKKETSLCNG